MVKMYHHHVRESMVFHYTGPLPLNAFSYLMARYGFMTIYILNLFDLCLIV